jgi:hypothetical protein
VALVFAQEIQEPFVVLGRHVEAGHEELVVAARMLETHPDEFAHVGSREIARHERLVDR